jgi:hypothetical protein
MNRALISVMVLVALLPSLAPAPMSAEQAPAPQAQQGQQGAPPAAGAPAAGAQGGRGGRGGQGGRGGNANAAPPPPINRMPDGKPNLTGFYSAAARGANYGLEVHPSNGGMPATQGVVVDPPDVKLPYQPWARAEMIDRELPHRGYDDPTAHCIVAGIPRSHYVPSPHQILQPPGYVIVLFERMSWRHIPIDPNRQHLPDNVRLWMGDSIGHWEGDVLVVNTKNLNGKAWLNERGDVLTHQATIVERFTPVHGNQIMYEATVTDPGAYTRPWTIRMPLNRQNSSINEILEVACHEDNGDLHILKDVRDEWRAKQKKEN